MNVSGTLVGRSRETALSSGERRVAERKSNFKDSPNFQIPANFSKHVAIILSTNGR